MNKAPFIDTDLINYNFPKDQRFRQEDLRHRTLLVTLKSRLIKCRVDNVESGITEIIYHKCLEQRYFSAVNYMAADMHQN